MINVLTLSNKKAKKKFLGLGKSALLFPSTFCLCFQFPHTDLSAAHARTINAFASIVNASEQNSNALANVHVRSAKTKKRAALEKLSWL